MTYTRKDKVALPKLSCTYCGGQGLYYLNHVVLHCESYACCAQCPECKDWFDALLPGIVPTLVDGPRPVILLPGQNVATPEQTPVIDQNVVSPEQVTTLCTTNPTPGEPLAPHAPDAPADPQDKKAYCEYGVKKEFEFIEFFNLYVEEGGVEINPKKETDPFAPDIILYGELADLKSQRTPFFTAKRYHLDPRFTVTFNRKDVLRYRELYPYLHIVFWIDWKTTEWSGIKVAENHAVYLATFEQIERLVLSAPLHEYKDRKHDREGNARSSYLLDVREFTQIYPAEQQELYTPQRVQTQEGEQPCVQR